MYRIKAYFSGHVVTQHFIDRYEAIDFKDTVDANYPLKVTFEKGVYPMQTFIVNSWNYIMNDKRNPLKHIEDLQTRHVVMQLLAWMWCIIFSMYLGSMWVFGITAVAHILVIAGIVLTVGTFETAKKAPQYFGGLGRGIGGEHE
jgi:hypothetical protein